MGSPRVRERPRRAGGRKLANLRLDQEDHERSMARAEWEGQSWTGVVAGLVHSYAAGCTPAMLDAYRAKRRQETPQQ
jgi:hypothetical protein